MSGGTLGWPRGAAAACALVLGLPCGLPLAMAGSSPREFRAEIMATAITVQFAGPSGDEGDAEAVFGVFRAVDALASEWKGTSALSELNRAAGGPAVAVPAELFALLQRGRELAERTDGAFDPTWAALWDLWAWPLPQTDPPPAHRDGPAPARSPRPSDVDGLIAA